MTKQLLWTNGANFLVMDDSIINQVPAWYQDYSPVPWEFIFSVMGGSSARVEICLEGVFNAFNISRREADLPELPV